NRKPRHSAAERSFRSRTFTGGWVASLRFHLPWQPAGYSLPPKNPSTHFFFPNLGLERCHGTALRSGTTVQCIQFADQHGKLRPGHTEKNETVIGYKPGSPDSP